MYGTLKLSYVVIFLVVLSKNFVNLSMYYVIILKTHVVLSIYSVDMATHCLIMLKNILFCHNTELSCLKIM